MTETNQSRSTPSYLILLILLLVTAVGIQAWYMMDMKRTLDTMQSERDPSVAPETTSADVTSVDPVAPGTASLSSEPSATEATIAASPGSPDNASMSRPSSGPANDQVIQKAQPENISKTLEDPANMTPSAPLSRPDARDYFSNRPYYAQHWNPHEELLRMQRQMDRIFNERYYQPDQRGSGSSRADAMRRDNSRPDFHYQFRQNLSMPEMDMRENQDEYIVLVNIPGADQKDISVNLEGQRLTVSGRQEYKNQQSNPDGSFVFHERRSGKFQRSITLAEPVEKKGMKTNIDNGILRVIIPKRK
jgi:HSP20 family molecular chaperone IbpA